MKKEGDAVEDEKGLTEGEKQNNGNALIDKVSYGWRTEEQSRAEQHQQHQQPSAVRKRRTDMRTTAERQESGGYVDLIY